jgi:DNA end-binding protein Ku
MARGIWKGTLGFGLVNIGVELFTAEAPHGLDLDMLDKRDHAPIGYRKYNKVTGKEIEGEDIVKGYQVSKGQYVILSPDDLKAANPKATQSIDVLGFVESSAIDRVFLDKPYVIGPLKGSEKAYALFVRTLEEMDRVGVAQVVIRTKQHVAAVYPWQGALVAQLMRYHDELRSPEQLGVDAGDTTRAAIKPAELTMARQLVEMMSTEFHPEEFRDTYREDVMRLIEERAAHPDSADNVTVASVDDSAPRVLDLMSALKGSLAARAHDKVVRRSAKVASTTRASARKSAPVASKTKSAAKPATKSATRARKRAS